MELAHLQGGVSLLPCCCSLTRLRLAWKALQMKMPKTDAVLSSKAKLNNQGAGVEELELAKCEV